MESHQYLILASDSPRRKALLDLLGFHFRIVPSGDEEGPSDVTSPELLAEENARSKTAAVADRFRDAWIIGADTIVVYQGAVLGKPADEGDALRMLIMLSGRTHTVFTGVCLVNAGEGYLETQHEKTDVTFSSFSIEEARAYLRTGEPMDKAGSYGAQGAGSALITHIEGSYTNVVGLPLSLAIDMMKKAGILEVSEEAGILYQVKHIP